MAKAVARNSWRLHYTNATVSPLVLLAATLASLPVFSAGIFIHDPSLNDLGYRSKNYI